MRLATITSLAAAALAGCVIHTEDPDESVRDGFLVAATPIATGALAIEAYDEVRVVLLQRDPATGDAVLRRHDVRDHTTVELDRMSADGTPQLVVVRQTIAWGFGNPGGGTFRLVDATGVPRALDFAGHAPATLLGYWPDPPALTYASARDCTIERLDLTRGLVEVRAQVSCNSQITAVAIDDDLDPWMYVRDQSWELTGLARLDGSAPWALTYVQQLLDNVQGPFLGAGRYWCVLFDDYGPWATVITGAQGQGPIPEAATRFAILDGPVGSVALLGDTPWLSYQDGNHYLAPLTPAGVVVRYRVDETAARMVALTNRMVMLLYDGTVLEQPLTPR